MNKSLFFVLIRIMTKPIHKADSIPWLHAVGAALQSVHNAWRGLCAGFQSSGKAQVWVAGPEHDLLLTSVRNWYGLSSESSYSDSYFLHKYDL